MNYLRLSECYRYFDSDNVYYFNREDYKFYSEEEMKQALLYWNKNDFVLVQHTSSLEVAKAYLIFLNNKNQIKNSKKWIKILLSMSFIFNLNVIMAGMIVITDFIGNI